MIKFQLFDTAQSYQCHFAEISTFVVSIAHYMRAYFNYQALVYGKEFTLPDDAAFLNVSVGPLRSSTIISQHYLSSNVCVECAVPKYGKTGKWVKSLWENWMYGT